MLNTTFTDYYRCPENYGTFELPPRLSPDSGFFQVNGAVCYGRTSTGHRSQSVTDDLFDAFQAISVRQGACTLPFDPAEIAENLRCERYLRQPESARFLRNAYYLVRPAVPAGLRKLLQRTSLRGWNKIPFPRWPVDSSVEDIFECLLKVRLGSLREAHMPLIWFWPDGYQGCVIMTHDVETAVGRDFAPTLMDVNDSFGIKSSFQVVPEERYEVSHAFLRSIIERGFELNIHGLNHNGNLFATRAHFDRQIRSINEYGKEYGARGFRSPVMYRNLEWYGALEFSYDMSVPNVAHLDPQRGGCCTVRPYFVGDIVELPLTTTQDYSLFNYICDDSIELWKWQLDLVLQKHGLVSFLIHPDYIVSKPRLDVYRSLLAYLTRICAERRVWCALPGDVDAWWRERSQMKLEFRNGDWRIKGHGSERARVAFASLTDREIVYQVEPAPMRAAG